MSARKGVSILLVLALGMASSSGVAAQRYTVSASLLHKGKQFAAPVVVVDDSTPADIEVSGADGYTFSVAVTRAGVDKLRISSHLDSPYGSMAPVVVVRPGEPATVSVGDIAVSFTAERSGS